MKCLNYYADKFKKQSARIMIILFVLVCGFNSSKITSFAKSKNVLMQMSEDFAFYMGDDYRSAITSITFLDKLKDAPSDAWDVSDKQDGSVMAWTVLSGHSYDMYVAGKGGVWANPNSTYAFKGFTGVTSIDFNNCFNTDNVTNMYGMFAECYSLESMDVSKWDISKVTDTSGMFYECYALNDLDVSKWNTSKVTDMSIMFYGCTSLENLDVSKWDTSKVEYMDGMFYGCSSLKALEVSKWKTSKVTDMSNMFGLCYSLDSIDTSKWNLSNVTNMENMFDDSDNADEEIEDNTSDSSIISKETREKADTGVQFDNNCIVDELGWVEDVSSTEEKLKTFYDETGVQPYVYLKAYDESLISDSDKEAYATSWYDENIDNGGTLLYCYFSEEEGSDIVGYMCCVAGNEIQTVMDSEALEVFWDYVNEYWYSDSSTDDMLVQIFDSTAEFIVSSY